MAKVVPLNKTEDRHHFTNYRPVSLLPRSTSLASIESIEEITNATDQKRYAAGLFLDLKKAFDTINHDRLINKQGPEELY